MSFYNQVTTALLSSDAYLDASVSDRYQMEKDLWSNLRSEYLKAYRLQYVDECGSVLKRDAFGDGQIKHALKRDWFIPRAVETHKYLQDIDDSWDYGRKFTWTDIREGTRKRLADLFDDMIKQVERDFHENSVYFHFWSRDCDQVEVAQVYRFDNWYEASQYIVSFYDDAEGPCHACITDFNHFLIDKRVERDRGLEHFEEYGYGH